MKLLRIAHAAINVKNLQTTFDWYNKVFGFEIIHKWTHTGMIGRFLCFIQVRRRPLLVVQTTRARLFLLSRTYWCASQRLCIGRVGHDYSTVGVESNQYNTCLSSLIEQCEA